MSSSNTPFLKGQLLIAMPALADSNFSYTVTFLAEHNAAGALGIVVNRNHPDLTARDIFAELGLAHSPSAASVPVYAGGPVHTGEVFILHGPPFSWESCFQITPTIAMSNSLDLLQAIAQGRGPSAFIIALGCAGWAQGQLEREIMENVWLTGDPAENIIFEVPPEDRWMEAVKKMGIDPVLLSGTAGHA